MCRDLYYYRARYYNAALGRFLQTDPAGDVDSLNLYQYALWDPVSNRDPTGKYSSCAEFKAETSGSTSCWEADKTNSIVYVLNKYAPRFSSDQSSANHGSNSSRVSSVNEWTNEGRWGIVHWTGLSEGVKLLRAALHDASRLKVMQPGIAMKEDAKRVLEIRANDSHEFNGWDYRVSIDARYPSATMTEQGLIATPLVIVLIHELGHAIFGYRDEATNIGRIENPARDELGIPRRTRY